MRRGFLIAKKAPITPKGSLSSSGTEQPDVPTRAGGQKTVHNADQDASGDLTIAVNPVLRRSAIVATIPPAGSAQGAQTCQIVTVGPTKEMILKNPALYKPLPASSPAKYAIQATANMGLGLFATANISFGERILVERPYVVLPKNIGRAFDIPQTGFTQDRLHTWHECCMDEAEKLLDIAVDRMAKDEGDQLKSCCGFSSEDPEKRPLVSILSACGANLEFEDAPGVRDFGNGYIGVPRLGSRINHSCAPNAVFDFDPDSFTILYTATREIKSGDQIFLTYLPAALPLAQRRQAMTRYGFVCECHACTNATAESDALRKSFGVDLDGINLSLSTASGRSSATRDLRNRVVRLKVAMEREGLDSEPRFSEIYAALARLHELTGNAEEALKCRRKLMVYATFPGCQRMMKKLGMRF